MDPRRPSAPGMFSLAIHFGTEVQRTLPTTQPKVMNEFSAFNAWQRLRSGGMSLVQVFTV